MNKYEFFANELYEMARIRHDEQLALNYEEYCCEAMLHHLWLLDDRQFFEAVHFGDIFDKDAETYPVAIQMTIDLDVDDFDTSIYAKVTEYSTKALHRKHRKSRRKSKVRRKNNDFVAGIGKGFKGYHHCAVRREYDIPVGKSNFTHKVDSYPFHY